MAQWTSQEEPDFRHHLSFTGHKPTECLLVDLFVHRDVVLGGEPIATLSRELTADHDSAHAPPPAHSATSRLAPPLVRLKNPTSALASPDVRNSRAIAEKACAEAGLNPEHFTVYRTRLEFPIATEELTLWWPLATRD